MNLFWRELKAHRKALFFWSLGMIACIGSGMGKYAAYSTTGQSAAELVRQLPKMIQVIFGVSGFDLTKATGFYGLLFMYIALMIAIHAVLLGAEIIAKEERDRTSEFLFVKPISRVSAVTSKLLAGLVNLVILNIVTAITSFYAVSYFDKSGSIIGTVLIFSAALFLLQLIFYFVGTAVAGAIKKPKRAPSIATSGLMFSFLLMILVNMSDKLESFKYLTPFKYFEAKPLMDTGKLDPAYLAISFALILVSTAITYRSFTKRDLEV